MEGPLRLLAVLLSAVVLLSFAMFAVDESRKGSTESQAGIADAQAALVEHRHSGFRRTVDQIDEALLRPFTWAAPAGSGAWAHEGLPTALALVVYGFGLAYVARITHARA